MGQVARREIQESTFDEMQVLADLGALLTLNDRIKELTAIKNKYRDQLSAAVESFGEEDARGHLWLELPDGRKIQRQRKEIISFDEEAAIPLLKEKAPECLVLVEVVDDDKLALARYDKRLSDADLAKIYPKTYQYALIPPKS